MTQEELNRFKKGKKPEEINAIDYFASTTKGCKNELEVNDSEFDAVVSKRVDALNLKSRALGKLGLDEDEVTEIDPVLFEGYEFDQKEYKTEYGISSKLGIDGVIRSSMFGLTYLFFSSTQIYLYRLVFSLYCGYKHESTEEYFYKDVTNFSSITETTETTKTYFTSSCMSQKENVDRVTTDYTRFAIIVPGDRFVCSTSGVKDVDRIIQGMKQKLREKKM